MNAAEIAQLLGGKPSGAGFLCHCPVHKDENPSLSVNDGADGRVLVKCHANCSQEAVLASFRARGVSLGPAEHRGHRQIVAEYNYRNHEGLVEYQVVRFEPKAFRQRRPSGNDTWEWNLKGVKPLPYRLPELISAVEKKEQIFVVEGEKDVEKLMSLGLQATCNSGGAGKWRDEFAKYLRGASVVIIPDNDEAGHRHAQHIAESIFRVTKSVKLLQLPGLPAKGDVGDFLGNGNSVAALLKLVGDLPQWNGTHSVAGDCSAGATLGDSNASAPVQNFTDTDISNSQRFALQHGRDVRFTPERGWYSYDGRRWRVDVKALNAIAKAKATALSIAHEIEDASNREERYKHAKNTQSKRAIEAMIFLARAEPGIALQLNQFDRDDWVLNVKNGTLDLRTGELRPHARADLITKIADVTFDRTASCTLWHAFLERIMGGNAELIAYCRRFVGYLLVGETSEQTVHFLYGSGSNGKSVFCEVLLKLLGDYAITASPDMVMLRRHAGIPNDIARLCGTRVAVMNETTQGAKFDEAKLKDLTGGDTLTARFLHQEFFDFRPTHRIVIRGNHKPAISGTDEGIWRRLRLLPFIVTIPVGQRDLEMPSKLTAELPGILNWALGGCLEWQVERLKPPSIITEAVLKYRDDSDTLGRLVRGTFSKPPVVHIHGALFFAWTALLVSQSVLAATKHLRAHRKVGLIAGWLVLPMLALGTIVAARATVHDFRAGKGDAAVSFFYGELADLAMFGLLAGAAMLLRNKPDFHKRWVLLGSLGLIGAAIGRIPELRGFSLDVFIGLIASMAVYDLFSRRSIHAATAIGAAVLLSFGLTEEFIGNTTVWLRAAHYMLGV